MSTSTVGPHSASRKTLWLLLGAALVVVIVGLVLHFAHASTTTVSVAAAVLGLAGAVGGLSLIDAPGHEAPGATRDAAKAPKAPAEPDAAREGFKEPAATPEAEDLMAALERSLAETSGTKVDKPLRPKPADVQILQKLAGLAALHDRGVLTDSEFGDKKSELLRRI